MSDQPSPTSPTPDLDAVLGCRTQRTGERTVSTTMSVHDGLRDARGGLRIGVVTHTVDMAAGLDMGLAVVDRERWVVTTDLDVHLVEPVVVGPLRVDAEVVRAGDTTAVSTFTLHDEDTGRRVGGGTATGRPFPIPSHFDRGFLDVPVGAGMDHRPHEAGSATVVAALGLVVEEDGSVELPVADWLRNPWGIVHGGVTACHVDVAAEVAASAVLGRPAQATGELIRYLAPGRVGPMRAVPRVLAHADGRVLVEVRVVDTGADDRLTAVATVTAV
jgi:uncharacterized protein (TIGR00369 family)